MSSALKVFGGNALITRNTWDNNDRIPAKRMAVAVPDWSSNYWEADGSAPGTMTQAVGAINGGPLYLVYGGGSGASPDIGETANPLASSPDLFTFTARAVTAGAAIYDGAWLGDKFFVGGISSAAAAGWTSNTGTSGWAGSSLGGGATRQPAYNPVTGMSIAFGTNITGYATSVNGGMTWTSRSGPWGTHVAQCIVVNGVFVVAAVNGIWFGTDGINWTASIIRGFFGELAPTLEFRGIGHNGTKFCAVAIATSTWNPSYPVSFVSDDAAVFTAVAALVGEGTTPTPVNDSVGTGALLFSNMSLSLRAAPSAAARKCDKPVMTTHQGRFVVCCNLTTLQNGASTVFNIVLTSYDGKHWTTMEGGSLLSNATPAQVAYPVSLGGALNILFYVHGVAANNANRLVSNPNATELIYVL